MLKFTRNLALFAILLVVFLELLFRFIIPAAEKPAYLVDPETKLVLFDSSFKTEGKYTWGRFPLDGGEWALNNDNWLSIYDYRPASEKDKPRVALIGDSFIAGLSTDKETHIDVRLTEDFGGTADFYSFGMGGQYLEQFRVLIDHLDEKYDPDVYVFFVNSWDIKSSLTTYGKYPLYYQLEPVNGEFKQISPRLYKESRFKRMARLSSLVLYLRFNAGITVFGGGRAAIVDANANPDQGNQSNAKDANPLLVETVNFILDKMLEHRPDKQFIFVGDGRRNLLYQGNLQPPLQEDCILIREACATRPQCYYLNLMDAFSEDYSQNGRMFNFEDNYHWNIYGSDLVAETVAQFIKDNQILHSSR